MGVHPETVPDYIRDPFPFTGKRPGEPMESLWNRLRVIWRRITPHGHPIERAGRVGRRETEPDPAFSG